MTEWWTYRPADFLMFAPRTYWRLFELHNTAWWPAPPLLLMAGGLGLAVLWRQRAAPGPALQGAALVLAVAWACSGLGFLMQRYAPINWAAPGLAAVFVLQALVLAMMGLRPAALRAAPSPLRWRAGLLLMLWALIGHPLLAPAFGRPLAQAEVWALAPDPTALATLGWLLAVRPVMPGARWLHRLAWVLAAAACGASAATLLTMGAAQGALVLALAGLAVAMAWRRPR